MTALVSATPSEALEQRGKGGMEYVILNLWESLRTGTERERAREREREGQSLEVFPDFLDTVQWKKSGLCLRSVVQIPLLSIVRFPAQT